MSLQKDMQLDYLRSKIATHNIYDSAIRLLLSRANFSDADAIEFKSIYPNWSVGVEYKKDWIVKYGDDIYRIGQDHTSQEQWIPGSEGTGALYSKIQITTEGYEIWKEWDGVSGAYAKDQIVQDPTDGNLYKSKIDSNIWGPPSTQPSFWELYVES